LPEGAQAKKQCQQSIEQDLNILMKWYIWYRNMTLKKQVAAEQGKREDRHSL
jgi:hypothetical protein